MRAILIAMALALGACASAADVSGPNAARFAWFEYSGADTVHEAPFAANQYQNPILQGFYPDPSITQVGGDYYLVTSTFSYFPGIPIFHSRDLVNWTQIGNVIDRPAMLNFDGLGMSRGVFAPTIEEHNGVFYVANTCVDCRGNYVVTATDPRGPWSDPIWLPQVGGIDPSLFFDDDGKVYIINNDAPPETPRYSGHRAVWGREVDPRTLQSISEPVVLINGGVRPEENPIWIEGPHIYKHLGWYYLSAAEGGTAINHSQVVLRSRHPMGPYEANPNNPILTQRHLSADRAHPITSVGHADFVTTPDGRWWVTFLGVRPYEGDFYNTGRETFLMPVRWENGWPVIVSGAEQVPYVAERPNLPPQAAPRIPTHGSFSLREEFDGAALDPYWLFVRNVRERWYALDDGALVLTARDQHIGRTQQPSYIGRRQQHLNSSASTEISFEPRAAGEEAGLVAFQNDDFYYALLIGSDGDDRVLNLKRRAGRDDPAEGVVIASAPLPDDIPVRLRIDARGGRYDFHYAHGDDDWTLLLGDADGSILSTRTAGGFIGVTFGMYAYAPERPRDPS